MTPAEKARLQQAASQAPQPIVGYPAPPPQMPPQGGPGTTPPPGFGAAAPGTPMPPGKSTRLNARPMGGSQGLSATLVAADGRVMNPQAGPQQQSVGRVRGANVVDSPNMGAAVRIQGQARQQNVRGARVVGQQGPNAPIGMPMGMQQPMQAQQPLPAPAGGTPPWLGGASPQQSAGQGLMVGNYTVMLAQHARPQLLEKQVGALHSQTLQPAMVAVTINPAGQKLNDALLTGMTRITAGNDLGPWWRWRIAQEFRTKYILMIDDDCFPGPQWLRRAYERMELAEERGESLAIVAAGAIYRSDDYADIQLVGPEAPTEQEKVVDLGRGAWFLRVEDLDHFHAYPRLGHETLAIPTHFAAAMTYTSETKPQRLETVVLPYPFNDRTEWGMTLPPDSKMSLSFRYDQQSAGGIGYPADWFRQEVYTTYRSAGWTPLCIRTEHYNPRPDAAETVRLKAEDIVG